MPTRKNYHRVRIALLAVSLTTILSACAASNNAAPARALPPASAAGDLFQPVPHPPIRAGDDPREKLAETTAALTTANRRISGARRWYEAIRSGAAGSQ